MTDIKPGDRVCFSRKFLQSIFQYTGWMPEAVGSVEALEFLGDGLVIAIIQWGPDHQGRANVKNLTLSDRKHLEPV